MLNPLPMLYRLWVWTVCLILVCLMATSSATAGQEPVKKVIRLAFISHAPDSDSWWSTIKNSLKQASDDFDVQVDYLNPPDGSIEQMAKIIQSIDIARYQAVVATIADMKLLAEPLRSLARKNIALVTVNSGTQEQSEKVGALIHIGQPDELAGFEAGLRLVKTNPKAKSFICFNHYPENTGSVQRCDGFKRGLGERAQMTMVSVIGDAKRKEMTIVSALAAAQSRPDAFLALGPDSVIPLLEVTRLSAMVTVPIVTFDLSSEIIAGIRQGRIAFAIDQQPYLQGYLSVGFLAERLRNPQSSLLLSRMALYSRVTLHQRMARYGLELKAGSSRHINSGPGFVTTINADKVERFSGQFR